MSTIYTSTLIYGLNIDDIDKMPEGELDKLAENLGLSHHYNGESYIGINILNAIEDEDNDPQTLKTFITKVNEAAQIFRSKMNQDGMLILIINSY